MKRRYKFINWIAEVLGCTELIDYDQYNEIVPTKPYTGPIPEGLLKYNDDLKDLISKYPHKTPFISKMHQIGFGMDKDSSPPLQHYEEPKYMPNETEVKLKKQAIDDLIIFGRTVTETNENGTRVLSQEEIEKLNETLRDRH